MARGIDLTFQVIAQSKNQAVVGLLDAAFQSTSQSVRKLAGKILVSKRSGQGLEAIIRNFDPTNSDLVELVNTHRDKIMPGLHGAIVDKDVALARHAFRLAYTQSFYEVLPTLTSYCLGPGSQDKSGLSFHADFLKFLNKYTEALEKNDLAEHQLLYNTILPELSKTLLQKIKEYRFTRHELTLTVFLRLYPFFSDAGTDHDLNLQLRLPNSPVYVASYRRLLKESETYLFKFITRCLDRLNPPPIVPQVISERSDIPFLDALFKSIKQPLTLEHKTNLAKLPPLIWIGQIGSFLNKFDSEAQCGLVLLAQNINLKEEELRACLLQIFERGNGNGRLAALSALAPFSGIDIDRAVLAVSEEEEPALQVEALTQLNMRAVPGSVARIMQFAGSPHETVRDTIKKLLPNFQFNRFLQSFDQLDDEQRRRMFDVVKKLDKQTPDELSKILSTGEPILRAKALLCVDYNLDIVPLIEDALCDVLAHDEMPRLRCKAAAQLVAGRRDESRMTLVQAFHRDVDPEVRTAARNSLEARPTYWDQHEES
jgi:hypothetical protein